MQVHTIYSFSDFCKCYFWKISHEVLSSSQHFMSVFLQVFISSLLLLTTEWKRKKVKVVQLCPTLRAHGLYSPWNSPGQNTEVRSLSLLQGIFPNQGLNPCLPHCRGILYQLSHKKAQDTGVGSLSLFQRIFPTQESHPGLLHCRWILYKLSQQGSPTIASLSILCIQHILLSFLPLVGLRYILTYCFHRQFHNKHPHKS